MAYIGAEPVPGQNREIDDISSGFNGSATAFTLQVSSTNVSPESVNNILVNLGGVMQNPGTDYTIAASTITFTTAPASGLSFWALILGAGINTATVADQTIGTSKVLDNSITADKLAHTSVTAGSYTTADITVDAQGRITAAASGSISGAEIADNAVTTAKINADAVTSAKIADDSINSEHYVDGSIDTAHIADSQITSAKIADGTIATGDIADDAVTSAKIADNSIVAGNIAADAVGASEIADNAVDAARLQSNAVTTAKIADDAVTESKINNNSVSNAKLADIQTSRIIGRVSSGTGDPEYLTASSVRSMINVADGATAGGGITMAQQWRQHTNTSNPSSITQNWEVNDNTIYGGIGSNMTEAAGVFTFPSTGIYYIAVDQTFHVTSNGEDRRCEIHIQSCTSSPSSNSSYSDLAIGYTNLGVGSSTTFGTASCSAFVDITDVSNRKVRFTASVNNSNTQLTGNSGYNENSYVFIRLGDT